MRTNGLPPLRDLPIKFKRRDATASYGSVRAGNSGMMGAQDFAAALDSLYVRSCK